MRTLSARRAVWLVMKRELNTRLRTRSFVIGTAVMLALLLGYVLFQTSLAGSRDKSTIGLTEQATGITQQVQDQAVPAGLEITTVVIADRSREAHRSRAARSTCSSRAARPS